jgi:hypothetical protein
MGSELGVGVALVLLSMTILVSCGGALRPTLHSSRQSLSALDWVRRVDAPGSWHRIATPTGNAVLAAPPSFTPIRADPGSISAAVRGIDGSIVAYLNVTPQQGAERLQGFGTFRVNLLGDDHDYAVHMTGIAQALPFKGGVGSCVTDHYVTRVNNNRYHEIACLVRGRHGGDVVVAAAANASWIHYRPVLRDVIDSFSVM